MRGCYSKAQFNKIKKAEKNIDNMCSEDIYQQDIIYDIDTVVDCVNSINRFDLTYNDIGTLLFCLIFGKDKITILNMLLDDLFDNFFPCPRYKGTSSHKLYHLMKKNIHLQLNMNKLLSCINKNNRYYFYEYVRIYYIYGLRFIVEYIDIFQKTCDSIRFSTIPSYVEKFYLKLDAFEDIAQQLLHIVNNVDEIARISEKTLDVFFKKNIRYYDIIPQNIHTIFDKIFGFKFKSNTENDGTLIEKKVIELITSSDLDEVVKSNAYFIDDKGTPVNNKKSEFDIIIGAYDKKKNIFRIKTIYDIKRSARLIQDDIDKFKSAVESDIILKDVCGQHILKTEKTLNFSYGYLYVNEWSIKKESSYKVRDILLEIIRKCNCYEGFFLFFCGIIKDKYLQFNNNFLKNIRKRVDSQNKILQSKLLNTRLRYITI